MLMLTPGCLFLDSSSSPLSSSSSFNLQSLRGDVILDSSDRPNGAKLKEAAQVGYPWQIIVGRQHDPESLEVRRRATGRDKSYMGTAPQPWTQQHHFGPFLAHPSPLAPHLPCVLCCAVLRARSHWILTRACNDPMLCPIRGFRAR